MRAINPRVISVAKAAPIPPIFGINMIFKTKLSPQAMTVFMRFIWGNSFGGEYGEEKKKKKKVKPK